MLKLIANWNYKTSLSITSHLSEISFAIIACKLGAVKTVVNSASVIGNYFDSP